MKLNSIQALRGVGAVAVVISHALTLYPFMNFRVGAAGVDLFFVISGVVMAISITSQTDPKTFFLRRIARVVPLYWLMTGLTVLYLYYFYPDSTVSAGAIIRSLLFLPQANNALPLLYPGWSLNFEIFFYLSLSILLISGKYCLSLAICLFTLLGSLSIISNFSGIYFVKYFLLEFASGMAIGLLMKHGFVIDKKIGLVMIISSLLLFFLHNYFHSDGFFAWGIPSILLIIGCYGFDNTTFLKSRPIQVIGDASYSIYLVHPFAIWLFEKSTPASKSIAGVAFTICLSIALGILTHLWIEKPLLRVTQRPRKKAKISQAAVTQ